MAETNFDPPQITDGYSRTIAANIYDAPLRYAFLVAETTFDPAQIMVALSLGYDVVSS